VLAESVSFSVEAPTHHVTEAMLRISHATTLVNALFWSTQRSTQMSSHKHTLNRSRMTQDRR
jgi:hypothetical protein